MDFGGAQSVDRALGLLALVGRHAGRGAALSSLVEESGLNKPTARRLLLALIRAGFVEQDEATRRYYLGADPTSSARSPRRATAFCNSPWTASCACRARRRTSAFVSVRRDLVSVCLHREEGTYPGSHPCAPDRLRASARLRRGLARHSGRPARRGDRSRAGSQCVGAGGELPALSARTHPRRRRRDACAGLRPQSGPDRRQFMGGRRRHPRSVRPCDRGAFHRRDRQPPARTPAGRDRRAAGRRGHPRRAEAARSANPSISRPCQRPGAKPHEPSGLSDETSHHPRDEPCEFPRAVCPAAPRRNRLRLAR